MGAHRLEVCASGGTQVTQAVSLCYWSGTHASLSFEVNEARPSTPLGTQTTRPSTPLRCGSPSRRSVAAQPAEPNTFNVLLISPFFLLALLIK